VARAIAVLVLNSFGGLMGLKSGRLGCLWMRLFMVVPMTPSAAASDPGGRRYCCLIVSTVFSPLSLTPANNFSAVSLTPAIKLLPDVVDTGQK
jgi:hypothetical protein